MPWHGHDGSRPKGQSGQDRVEQGHGLQRPIVNIAASNQAIKSCERVQETLDSIYTFTVPPTTPPQFPTKWPTLAPTSSE
ncbi:hypothetical protein HZS61_012997 [Fusarium oxysporum f. sp. conglutinans]|uniref:Uncharacterized protein n=1 Tax=Fusarium oxysporum f. sp. conglutinans TaxID=100902 RepID=A0A8H6GUA2_FUSOX|nr:hypothetical protein HZS61_012997 [Fusarium oxysporum f. sp. conglutinans]